jgi:hypothetical protein
MSKIKFAGNASGTGTLTIAAPNTNTDRTIDIPDGDGELLLANGDGSQLTNLPAGYTDSDALTLFNATGSAPVYACRAWVNFDGSGVVAIRESGNVSSITDNGTGYYSVNFTTAMLDNNYAASITATDNDGAGGTDGYSYSTIVQGFNSLSTSTLSFAVGYPANTYRSDNDRIMVAVHR